MKRAAFLVVSVACASAFIFGRTQEARTQGDADEGKKMEQTSCLPCHSLRLIESQRLSEAAWQKEVDKMIGWGAVVSNRQLLVQYLSQHYSNTQAPAGLTRSADSK